MIESLSLDLVLEVDNWAMIIKKHCIVNSCCIILLQHPFSRAVACTCYLHSDRLKFSEPRPITSVSASYRNLTCAAVTVSSLSVSRTNRSCLQTRVKSESFVVVTSISRQSDKLESGINASGRQPSPSLSTTNLRLRYYSTAHGLSKLPAL